MTIFVDSHRLIFTFLSMALLIILSLAPHRVQYMTLIPIAAKKNSYRIWWVDKYSNVFASIVKYKISTIIDILNMRLSMMENFIVLGFFSSLSTLSLFQG